MTNAILMASGLGSRLRPLTEITPKPLLQVGGKPMIETIIEGLIENNIDKIYIVVGYLGEQFKYLTKKYKNIELIKNPYYEIVNNISSIYVAREVLQESDCYICEADLFIKDKSIFKTKLNHSCYFGKMVKGYSDDWVFEIDKDNFISRVGKFGTDCYNMVGVSYFNNSDAQVLSDVIKKAFGQKGYEQMFWDDVINNNLDKLKLLIHPISNNQIYEIDTVEELNSVNEEVLKWM